LKGEDLEKEKNYDDVDTSYYKDMFVVPDKLWMVGQTNHHGNI
jgi:hypothetical protein